MTRLKKVQEKHEGLLDDFQAGIESKTKYFNAVKRELRKAKKHAQGLQHELVQVGQTHYATNNHHQKVSKLALT